MILTNTDDLPQALVDAVKNDPYDNGGAWRSVTQLISPPRVIMLNKLHHEELSEDVTDRLASLYGQIMHGILERANVKNLVEERLFMNVYNHKISGQFDCLQLDNGRLTDWKLTTVSKLKALSTDWLWQMNILACLFLSSKGIHVQEAEICAVGKDWSKRKKRKDPNYPRKPVRRFQVPLWTPAEQWEFLKERVSLHIAAETNLPECTPPERWAGPSKYAVTKVGQKRAVKGGVYDDLEFAEQHVRLDPDGLFIAERPGESIRCNDFCSVAPFCGQWKKLQAEEAA